MNNYEYIIAGLPVLSPGYRYPGQSDFASLVGEIREQLSGPDNALVDFLLRGLDPDGADADFYAAALRHRNRFIREYFRFDFNYRNIKVRWINEALGRPEGTDIMTGPHGTEEEETAGNEGFRSGSEEFEEEEAVRSVLAEKDLLLRERKLDELVWNKVDSLTLFDWFNIDAVLGFIVRLRIVDRWLILDEASGRRMFRRLVEEVRGTFQHIIIKDKE